MDNYKSIADPASHWTRQGKRQRARTHEECLSCTQVNFHLSYVFPLAILKIWHFGNNAWMKSKKIYQFGFLITSVWTQTLTSPSLTSHPSFSIPTLAALFQTHKCTGLGGGGGGLLAFGSLFFFYKEFMYIHRYRYKTLFPLFHPYFNQSNQIYSASPSCFSACILNSTHPRTHLKLILCHTQYFWTLAGN